MTNINTGATGLKTFAELYGAGYQLPGGPISTPALQNNTPQAPAPNLTQDGTNSLEKSPKSDTITIAGKTINKKTAIKAGLGALATAAVIGIGIFAFKGRGKTPLMPVEPPVPAPAPAPAPAPVDIMSTDPAKLADELQASANEMLQRANKIIETAQKKVEAVTELFKNGGKDASGKVVATIEDSTDPKFSGKIMKEFAEDGTTVIRESQFDTDGCYITDFLADGSKTVTDSYLHDNIGFSDGIKQVTYEPSTGKGAMHYIEGIAAKPTKQLDIINGHIQRYKESTAIDEGGSFIEKIMHCSQKGPDVVSIREVRTSDSGSTDIGLFFDKLEDGTWEPRP